MLCCVDGCTNQKKYKTGFCNKHQARWQRHGHTDLKGFREPVVFDGIDPILQNMNNLRRLHKLSISDLAIRSGVARWTLYRMTTTDPTLETLRALAACFGVDYWRLLIPGEFSCDSSSTSSASSSRSSSGSDSASAAPI